VLRGARRERRASKNPRYRSGFGSGPVPPQERTLPVLIFRLLCWIVGCGSYVPYLVPLILLDLLIAALLRVVMRRAGVNAWRATAAATAFVRRAAVCRSKHAPRSVVAMLGPLRLRFAPTAGAGRAILCG
jgi:hypothetical protein